jgi:tetratricopeptide (TPR) repeat protein
MSLLKRLLGGRDPDEDARRADALRDEGELGQAKLIYEKAARALEKTSPERATELREQADACRDGIARKRMDEAERLLDAGSEDLAISEWEAAIETAADTDLVERIERRLAEVTGDGGAQEAAAPEELSGDPDEAAAVPDAAQRYEMLLVSFEEDRIREYDALGTRMRDALLALHEERAAEALPELEALVDEADAPRYLHFEVARARLLTEDPARAREALRAFIGALDPDEGGEARVLAHLELASAAQDDGDFEGALAQYEAAIGAAPDDPRPYVAMARCFRDEGLHDEAIDVLESATSVLGALHPVVAYEQARAHADAGRPERARPLLERAAALAPPEDPVQERIAEALSELATD